MTAHDHATLIAAAEGRAAEAHAEVARLQKQLADEQAARSDTDDGPGLVGKPTRESAEDAIAEARHRGAA